MRRRYGVLLCVVLLSLLAAVVVYAEDLPIDITAIGRREAGEGQIATRVGANLFTADSQRVNYAFAEQIRIRQSAVEYLFAEVPHNYEVEPREQIISAANNSALFVQPVFISSNIQTQTSDPISMWIVVPIIAICALGGFIWALVSAKKKGKKEIVH